MTNTQTAAIAASILSVGLIVGGAVLRPWVWFAPEPPLCIGIRSGSIEAVEFARKHGCRLM